MPAGRGPLPQAQGVPLGAATVGPLIQPEKWLRPPHLLQRLRSVVAEASFSRLHFADPSLILLCDVSPLIPSPRSLGLVLGKIQGPAAQVFWAFVEACLHVPSTPSPPPRLWAAELRLFEPLDAALVVHTCGSKLPRSARACTLVVSVATL